jgi:trehalose synthase
MNGLAAYEAVAGASTVLELAELAKRLSGRRLLMVNSTRVGGGVAEILNRMVPILTECGLDVRWEIIEGTEPFYRVTKAFHNALHGSPEAITKEQFDLFLEVGRANARQLSLDQDLVFIHDPQPIVLIERRNERPGAKWLWRCHIDVSRPDQRVWSFLEPYILRYDGAVYSAQAFTQRLPMRQMLIPPSIDPLSEKNKDLSREQVDEILEHLQIPRDVPIITQVSRFDKLKDPVGVVDVFRRVRKSVKCRLILAGGTADDDPEGAEVLAQVREAAKNDPEIHLLLLPNNANIEINALQRASAVVLQKSLREGFGLTVSEALWKARPVVASAVGGIPLQVKHHYSGLLVHSIEGCARAVKQLLMNPSYAKQLGENGREHVRANFLLTRHITDYLLAFLTLGETSDTVFLNGR